MTDAELAARLRANLVSYKLFQSERGTLRALSRPGAWAFAIAEQPDMLHPQQVFFTDTQSLRAALPELEAFYRDLGVRFWRVQVPQGDTATARLMEQAGYEPRQGVPAMGKSLTGAPLEAPKLTPEPLETLRELVLLNAQESGPMVRIPTLPWHSEPQPSMHILGLREGGQLLSGGMAYDAGDTTAIYLMATASSARGRGLASDVMRGLLLAARSRGLAAAVLQSTPAGHGLYRRLGFKDLELWTSWVRPVN